MESRLITAISNKIYQRFPDFKGVRPSVQTQAGGNFLLIFKTSSATPDGHTIQRAVRVVAAPDGKMIKVTTSR